jgi:hypothetical protein
METVQKVLEISPETLTALEKLAKITGAGSVGELIQDALRVFEWAVYQQANGRTVLAATLPDGWKLPESAPDVETLGALFDKEDTEHARQFFKAA